jgi:hypothetical protein
LHPNIFVNEILSQMIEIWMKINVVTDHSCNIEKNIQCLQFLLEMTNNIKFTFSIGDTTPAVYN